VTIAVGLGPREDSAVGAVEDALEEVARKSDGRAGVGVRARPGEERELLQAVEASRWNVS